MEVGVKKWQKIIASFPTVQHLAEAREDQILKAWEGLGYYRRARFLHKAANIINTNGEFPKSYIEWLKLPGIGPYTAAAISSITLNENMQTSIKNDGNSSLLSPAGGLFVVIAEGLSHAKPHR